MEQVSVCALTALSCFEPSTEIWLCRRRRSSRVSSTSKLCRSSRPNTRLTWATYIKNTLCRLLRSALLHSSSYQTANFTFDCFEIQNRTKFSCVFLYQFPLWFAFPGFWGDRGIWEKCSSAQAAAHGKWTSKTPRSQGMIWAVVGECMFSVWHCTSFESAKSYNKLVLAWCVTVSFLLLFRIKG